MKKDKKAEFLKLPFELDEQIDDSLVTAHAGVPLLVELFRATGAARVLDESVKIKSRKRGLSASETAESLFALWAAGGERCEDLQSLREDAALTVLLGHEIPAPNTVRDFMESFHEEDLPLLQSGPIASVPSESAPLQGLDRVNRGLCAWAQKNAPEKIATLDIDASIYVCGKESATMTYEGERGYQPVVVVWAEKDLVVADEFRTGNVPAKMGNIRILEKAFSALPAGVEKVYVRSDSALYGHKELRFLDDNNAGYGISAVMNPPIKEEIEKLAESDWKLIEENAEATREWAEVAYCPDDGDHRKDGPVARRYLAIRIKKKQGVLFSDGTDRRHFAVVTNLDWAGEKILAWQRKKAGTVEHVHDVMKNGLAAGAFPSGKFGANAAWFRLNVICYNLLSLFKRQTLPGEFWTAKPKRLRFALLNTVGKVVRHAGKTLLRVSTEALRILFDGSRSKILIFEPA
jgi:hypothetical protein